MENQMKKNRRKKNKDRQRPSQANDGPMVINFREQLKSQDPEVRDSALQLLRQAGVVSVRDSETLRAMLIDADKVKDLGGGKFRATATMRHVVVQVDDAQSDEQADESDQQIEELRTFVEETSGPWKYSGNLQDAEKKPRFMFMNQGVAWGSEFADVRGLVFAKTRKVAQQYVAWMQEHQGIKLVIADVQAVAHKPLEALLMDRYRDGDTHYLVIRMVNREEVPFNILPLDSIVHEVDGWLVLRADLELPKYSLTCDSGTVVYDDLGNKRGPVLAHTRETAERYAVEMERRSGVKPAVVDIEAVSGMPVNEALDALVEIDSATCALVIRSVADDGETVSDFIYPANTEEK
jgi:hypothetical protein